MDKNDKHCLVLPEKKKRKMKYSAFIGIIACLLEMLISASAGAQPPGVKRTELQRHDLDTKGWEAVQVRIDFAASVSFGRHKHPGEEIIYVLEGTLQYLVDGKPPVTLKAGEVLFIRTGVMHAARNVGKGQTSELATYVVEKGKPLVVMERN
jgi:quercetin dioxygenase-like cupin family protein